MTFDYSNVLILGYGASGKSVENVLKYIGVDYDIYDENIIHKYNILNKITNKNLKLYDLAVLSPGISIYSKIVNRLKKCGVKVISEIEFAYLFSLGYIIAVTGTNGKTTTVNLINHILTKSGVDTELVGNVGTPFSDKCMLENKVFVVEVSSFQLEAIEYFRPNIAVLLNIAPDHIERHKSYKNYMSSKFKIFQNQTECDTAIVSRDVLIDNYLDDVKSDINIIMSKGINIEDGCIYVYNDNDRIKVCEMSDILHINTAMENILASILTCFLYGVNVRDIMYALQTYVPPKQRCEVVKIENNITYINDSKSTNIHSMIYAVNTYKHRDICLMLGGFDKKLDFVDFIAHIPNNIYHIVLFGPAGKRIAKLCKKYHIQNYTYCEKLINAIQCAKANARENSVVLFSPANSSFDEFSSYIERGKFFENNI